MAVIDKIALLYHIETSAKDVTIEERKHIRETQAICPIALGRKNWLFIGSESAGKRAAVIMSLLASAKTNGLNPAHWLSDTLERLLPLTIFILQSNL